MKIEITKARCEKEAKAWIDEGGRLLLRVDSPDGPDELIELSLRNPPTARSIGVGLSRGAEALYEGDQITITL